MRTHLIRGLVAAGLFAALAAPGVSQPLPRPIDDTEENCTVASLFPGAAYVPVVDSGDQITVDLFVLGDRGITEQRMKHVIARAQKAYAPLRMALNIVGAEEVIFQGTDAKGLINQGKRFLGGRTPPGVDAVLVFTSVDITGSIGSGVAGQADCVGGIAFPTKAFVVVEDDRGDEPYDWYVAKVSGNPAAKIAAHELAHLFGAHHQYANCAEGIPSEADEGEASPCTLMFNDVGLISLAFSTVEATVVRGYALEHLDP